MKQLKSNHYYGISRIISMLLIAVSLFSLDNCAVHAQDLSGNLMRALSTAQNVIGLNRSSQQADSQSATQAPQQNSSPQQSAPAGQQAAAAPNTLAHSTVSAAAQASPVAASTPANGFTSASSPSGQQQAPAVQQSTTNGADQTSNQDVRPLGPAVQAGNATLVAANVTLNKNDTSRDAFDNSASPPAGVPSTPAPIGQGLVIGQSVDPPQSSSPPPPPPANPQPSPSPPTGPSPNPAPQSPTPPSPPPPAQPSVAPSGGPSAGGSPQPSSPLRVPSQGGGSSGGGAIPSGQMTTQSTPAGQPGSSSQQPSRSSLSGGQQSSQQSGALVTQDSSRSPATGPSASSNNNGNNDQAEAGQQDPNFNFAKPGSSNGDNNGGDDSSKGSGQLVPIISGSIAGVIVGAVAIGLFVRHHKRRSLQKQQQMFEPSEDVEHGRVVSNLQAAPFAAAAADLDSRSPSVDNQNVGDSWDSYLQVLDHRKTLILDNMSPSTLAASSAVSQCSDFGSFHDGVTLTPSAKSPISPLTPNSLLRLNHSNTGAFPQSLVPTSPPPVFKPVAIAQTRKAMKHPLSQSFTRDSVYSQGNVALDEARESFQSWQTQPSVSTVMPDDSVSVVAQRSIERIEEQPEVDMATLKMPVEQQKHSSVLQSKYNSVIVDSVYDDQEAEAIAEDIADNFQVTTAASSIAKTGSPQGSQQSPITPLRESFFAYECASPLSPSNSNDNN
ncbi:hypothetical protein MIR68_009482 [Amoeboaphelidium protococcarum]|nr:hypothetical protein MIR68_009482 [Amoeboaphelidium protococcarum]